MPYTHTQIDEIERRQLTGSELMILRMNVKLQPVEIADKLEISRQRVHEVLKRAERKIELQGGA